MATAVPGLPAGTVVAVRHADPAQSAGLDRIMSILGQPMPASAGPGTEIVVKMPDGSTKSVATPTASPLAPGQRVSVTKTPDGVALNPI
jgi:hypothetical protein